MRRPKASGYEALHLCIRPFPELPRWSAEVQVRSRAMHFEAEHGEAAHWRYKLDNGHAQAGGRQA